MANPITSLYIDPQTLYVGIGTQRPQARLTVAGHICPSTTLTYDLGTSNLRFRDLYLSGTTIDIGGTAISRDATTGGLKVTDPSAGDAPLDMTVRNLTASNVQVIGDYVTLNTVTSNTEQVVVTNAGTGPALQVTQTGANSIAEFYDKESGIALYVGNQGNIGIGTSFPMTTLDIFSSNTTIAMVVDQRGIGNIAELRKAGEKKVVIDTNGNVGIGTVSAKQKLDVNGIVTATTFQGSGSGLTNVVLNNLSGTRTTNGYQYIGNGMIIQWGQDSRGAVSTQAITFPIAFPNACLSITANDGAYGDTGGVDFAPSLKAVPTTTGATFSVAASARTMHWTAIGY